MPDDTMTIDVSTLLESSVQSDGTANWTITFGDGSTETYERRKKMQVKNLKVISFANICHELHLEENGHATVLDGSRNNKGSIYMSETLQLAKLFAKCHGYKLVKVKK